MLSPRRWLVAVACAICLFLLLRHTTSSSTHRTPRSSRLGSPRKAKDGRGATPSDTQEAFDPTGTSSKHDYDVHDMAGTQSHKNKQIPLNDISRKPLRQRLEYHFPYDLSAKFPNYIWQTWKYTPSSRHFRDVYREFEASWTTAHPGFIHEVITDEVAVNVLRHLYSAVPDVMRAYEALPRPVLKADFFRYLILLARGGIYTDIDTFAIRSAVEWVPLHVPRSSYGLVVGVEADPDREDWAQWYSRRIQFCQWTIQAKAGHPILREIVAQITEKTLKRQADGTLNHDHVNGVIEFTGPGPWTDAIFGFFNDPLYFDMTTSSSNITWREFTGMTAARKVGDVVVLPITAFSPGIETMGAGDDDDPMAMVKHYFDGTWKPENERHIGQRE